MVDSKDTHQDENGTNLDDSPVNHDRRVDSDDVRVPRKMPPVTESETSSPEERPDLTDSTEQSLNENSNESASPEDIETDSIPDDGLEDIAQKLEADLLSELQSALEKPLVIPNDENSPNSESDHSDTMNQNETDSGQTLNAESGSQLNKEEVSIRILQESRNLTGLKQVQKPTAPQNIESLSRQTKEIESSEQVPETQEEHSDLSSEHSEYSETNEVISHSTESAELQHQVESPQQSRLDGHSLDTQAEKIHLQSDSQPSETEVEQGQNKTAKPKENQMAFPEIRTDVRTETEVNEIDLSDAQDQISDSIEPVIQPPKSATYPGAESSGAKRGISVSFAGLILLMICGGALFAYSTFTTEPEVIDPVLVLADKSPMKIFPETEETDVFQKRNGKIIFDRVEGRDSDLNGQLTKPEEVEIADLSQLAENNQPSNAEPLQTRTVVVRPDGTVIEEDSADNSASQDPVEESVAAVTASTETPESSSSEVADANSGTVSEVSSEEVAETESGEVEVASNVEDSEAVSSDIPETSGTEDNSGESVEEQTENPDTAEEPSGSVIAKVENLLANSEGNEPETAVVPDSTSPQTETVDPVLETEQPQQEVPDPVDTAPASEPTESAVATESVEPVDDLIEAVNVVVNVLPKQRPNNQVDLAEASTSPASLEPVSNATDDPSFPITQLQPGTPVIQLLADRNVDTARAGYETIRNQHPELLQNLSPIIQVAEIESRTWYRVQIEMESLEAAVNFCLQLRQVGQDCIPKSSGN